MIISKTKMMRSPGGSKRKHAPIILEDPESFFTLRSVHVTTRESKRSAEQVVEDRINTYNEIYTLLEEYLGIDEPHSCPDLTSADMGASLRVGPRIGSPGKEGSVHILFLRDHDASAALKVVLSDSPIRDRSLAEQANITEEASHLVKNRISPFFPLVYASVPCSDLLMPPPADKTDPYWSRSLSIRYDNSVTYAIKHALIEKYLHESDVSMENMIGNYGDWSVHRMAALVKQRHPIRHFRMFSPTPVEEVNLDEFPMTIKLGQVPLRGRVLIMELVWGDLNAYMRSDVNTLQDEWNAYTLIKEILMAIRDMQEHLNVLHGDLHVENILVIPIDKEEGEGKRPMPLIHDFGRTATEITGEWTRMDERADAKKILGSIAGWATKNNPTLSRPVDITPPLMNRTTLDHIYDLKEYINRRIVYRVSDILKWWEDNAKPKKLVTEEGKEEERGTKQRRVRTPISATDCIRV